MSGAQHTAFVLLKDRFDHKAGTTVYEWSGYDYGLRRDDEQATRVPHMCVSLVPNDYPFFTVPRADIAKATGEAA